MKNPEAGIHSKLKLTEIATPKQGFLRVSSCNVLRVGLVAKLNPKRNIPVESLQDVVSQSAQL